MGAAAASIFDDNATLFVALLTPFTLPVSPRGAASWPGRHSRFCGGPALGPSVMVRLPVRHAGAFRRNRFCDVQRLGVREPPGIIVLVNKDDYARWLADAEALHIAEPISSECAGVADREAHHD